MKKLKKLILLIIILVCLAAQSAYSSEISENFYKQDKEFNFYFNQLSRTSTKVIHTNELLNIDIGKVLLKKAGLNNKHLSNTQIEKRYSLLSKVDHFSSIKLLSIKRTAIPENPEQLLYTKKIAVVKGDFTGEAKKNEIIGMFAKIKDFIGTSYKKGGNGTTNIDCSNLVKKVFASLGIEMPRVSRSQFNVGKKIDVSNLIAGDLVFFKIRKNSISHVGIYLGENKFVHSSPRKGVMISDINESYFKKYFAGATRIIGEEPE